MSVTFVSAGAGQTRPNPAGSTTWELGSPSGAAVGDVFLAFLGGNPGISPVAPSGWTALYNITTGQQRHACFAKVATSADLNTTINFTGGNGATMAGVIVAYRGTSLPTISANTVTTTTTATAPTVTTPGANCYVVSAFASYNGNNGASFTAVGSPYTARYTTTTLSTNASTALEVVDTLQAAAGTSSPASVTNTGTGTTNGMGTVALVPTNNAPTATTVTSPATGNSFDCTAALQLTWPFTDPDAGDTQSKFDLRYRVQGASTWTTPAALTGVVSTSSTATIPANTFTSGQTAEVQVQTYDSQGLASGWGASWLGNAVSPPPTPTFTTPSAAGTIATSTFTATISAPNSTALTWRVVGDNAGSPDTTNVLQGPTTINDPTARSFTTGALTNGSKVHLQARVTYSGLPSGWADSGLQTVSYTPPAAPTVALAYDSSPTSPTGGSMLVTITDPTPTGTQPTVSSHEVWIDNGEGLKRRAVAVAGTYRWWTPVHGRDYGSGTGRVQVVAIGANGTTTAVLT